MKPDTFDTDNLSLALTKEQRTLETTSYDYTVDYLISLIKEGQMILEKPVEPLWKTEKASKLIESLLMNFPISLLYLIEHEKWLVVDGKQRLFTIFNFHQNQYKLTALEIVKEFENLMTYRQKPSA
jgi:hypothetical protein